MSAHTDSPWRYEFQSGYVVGPRGKVLAFLSHSACEDDPSLPKLITAAPELLEAVQCLCEEMADYMKINHLGDPNEKHNYRLGMVAIAKATTP